LKQEKQMEAENFKPQEVNSKALARRLREMAGELIELERARRHSLILCEVELDVCALLVDASDDLHRHARKLEAYG
jgi:hypothetical protein